MIANGQKAYGKEIDITGLFLYMKQKLESRFTVSEVIHAINKYTDRKDDIPTPADIINILKPVVKISESEYIDALKQREQDRKHGCSSQFSYASSIISEYLAQEYEDDHDREPFQITGDMKALLQVKKI